MTTILMFARLPLRGYQCLEHKVWIMSLPCCLMYQLLFVAGWQEDIRTAIPGIVECLKSKWYIRQAAIKGLSMLGAQGIDCALPFDILNLVYS